MRLVLATANADKVKEIEALLSGFELVPRPAEVPDVDETGITLTDNARLKAKALVDATDLPAVADDTGLEVAALDGKPGVHSARYAGESATYAENVAQLLAAMRGIDDRRARFRTVALALFPDGREVAVEGITDGVITQSVHGAGGFGYDPIFQPNGSGGRTYAELSLHEKNAISHRGKAFRALAAALTNL